MEKYYFISTVDYKKVILIMADNIHLAKEKLPVGKWEWFQLTGDKHEVKAKKNGK